MTQLLFALGAALIIIGSIRINDFKAEGPTVRAAGLVLTMPLIATWFFYFMMSMIFGEKMASTTVGLVEFFTTVGAFTLAYSLLFRTPEALKSLLPKDDPLKKVSSRKPRSTFPKIMTITQAALYLGISEKAVMELIEQGKIAASRLASGYRISRSVLDDYLNQSSETE